MPETAGLGEADPQAFHLLAQPAVIDDHAPLQLAVDLALDLGLAVQHRLDAGHVVVIGVRPGHGRKRLLILRTAIGLPESATKVVPLRNPQTRTERTLVARVMEGRGGAWWATV